MNPSPCSRCFALLYVLLAACASTPHGRPDLLKVVDREGATESEVIEALGAPHARYDENRVLAYRLGANKDGYYIATDEDRGKDKDSWTGVKYNLILEFDNGVLARHRLIEIRPDTHASGNAPAR